MKKWEYAMLSVWLDKKGDWTMRQGTSTLEWEGIHKFFNSLGTAGWELVSVVSTIGDTNPEHGAYDMSTAMSDYTTGVTSRTQHRAGTIGYLFSFKREIVDETIGA